MRIAVVGTGYVGLVSGTCLAEVGHSVVCVDLDQSKINALRGGKSPIYEPGLEAMIKRNIEHERLSFTTSLADALSGGTEVVFIAVGTPEGEDGSSDLRYVEAVAADLGRLVTQNIIAVVKSTVPVGTCDLVERTITTGLAQRNVSHQVVVASNPEFLKEGTAIDDFMRPDRIVVGLVRTSATRSSAEDAFRELYRPFVMDDPGRLLFMDRRSSELTKYGANAMLATRITFMNELAQLCGAVGANVDDVRIGIGADPRIGRKFLYAGPGYGGSCFPKDVEALVASGRKHSSRQSILEAVGTANRAHKAWATGKVTRHFGGALAGRRVAVWGLAFKPGTDDVRETPALTVVKELLAAGAEVVAHDPEARTTFARSVGEQPKLKYADDAYAALEGADALVLVTEWSEYRRPNWEKAQRLMRSRAVFDLRNQYSFATLAKLGFHYECVGRPDSATSNVGG